MNQGTKQTKDIVAGQLEYLRDDFRRLTDQERFRIYLRYLVEFNLDRFNSLVDQAINRDKG